LYCTTSNFLMRSEIFTPKIAALIQLLPGLVKPLQGKSQRNRLNGRGVNDGVDYLSVLTLIAARSARVGCERQIAINARESL